MTKIAKELLGRRIRWAVYNFAFRFFGRTRLWPRLGYLIWN